MGVDKPAQCRVAEHLVHLFAGFVGMLDVAAVKKCRAFLIIEYQDRVTREPITLDKAKLIGPLRMA